MKNQYAARLMATKAAISSEERKHIVHRCCVTLYQSAAVALNEQFGFGQKRIVDFRNAVQSVMDEYEALQTTDDVDYADAKLEQRYRQIMGDDA